MASNREINPEISQEIFRRLAATEREHNVRILYCCESGSRAWGFSSPDSDYDVRFIYVHEEDWYLSFDVEQRRDVIEHPIVDEIDCAGWDLRKALYLFTRTNGALLEWLNSPIRYIEQGDCAAKLRNLASRGVNNVALCYHYSHMARRNAREYLYRDRVKLKKYFYVLRPLLAIRYIEAGKGIPPVEFERLVEAVAPTAIRSGISDLLAIKRVTPELGLGDPIPEINTFIAAETARHGKAFHGQGRPDIKERAEVAKELNALFRESIKGEHRGSHPTKRH